MGSNQMGSSGYTGTGTCGLHRMEAVDVRKTPQQALDQVTEGAVNELGRCAWTIISGKLVHGP